MNVIIQKAISKVFPKQQKRPSKKQPYRKRIDFSKECQFAKRVFKRAQRALKCDKTNLNRRQQYIQEKKKYKKFLYNFMRKSKITAIHKLNDLENKDPKDFWKQLKQIISPCEDYTKYISPENWLQHFKSVLQTAPSETTNAQFQSYVEASLPNLEKVAEQSEALNATITEREIHKSIKGLKSGKAVYFDEISNDALKSGYEELKEALTHLFNIIYGQGVYPDAWCDGFIVPIHKKNNIMDVNNYRGIIISSCIGKLFLRIITRRIEDFMISSHKWSFNQCGFKPDHRTEDSIFILNTIFEAYVTKQNAKVYLAFVDFSKFFDKINRSYLLYRLLKYGITGKAYGIIKSMYGNTGYTVRVNDFVSPRFIGNLGVKQGCWLSPTLSNIFQNDLHEIFSNGRSDPVFLGNTHLNSLSWADDLVLMSTSKEGLQKCLDNLQSYCCKWGLEVNAEKTKTMTFSKRRVLLDKPLIFGDSPLEDVDAFNYLGFCIKHNNDTSGIINDRVLKARRVTHMLMQCLSINRHNKSPLLSLKLFDKQIVPILHYGAAIWSVPKTNNYIYLNYNNGAETRNIVTEALRDAHGNEIPYVFARKVDKCPINNSTDNRRILVKLQYIADKENLLRERPNIISNYHDKRENQDEKLHQYFCKRSLNISK